MADSVSERTIVLLGGAQHQVGAIQAAHQLGFRTVLCDYLLDNPGQEYSDIYYPCSTTDKQAVLNIAVKEKADGILSFGTDVAAPTAAFVATELGLPTNPYESTLILTDKIRFRKFLMEKGYPCPRAVSLEATDLLDDVIESIASLRFPVVIKPLGSSGSKGVSVVESSSRSEVEKALSAAAAFSRSGELIAEERIGDASSPIFGGDIFVQDGKVAFWGLMRCIRDLSVNPLIPVGEMYPPLFDDETEKCVHELLQSIVSDLGIRFCEMNVEILMDKGIPYLIELAPRAGGNFIPLQLQDISGINLIDANVLCAMGEDPKDLTFSDGPKCISSFVLHSREPGVLSGIEYPPEYKDHLYREFIYLKPGDEVERFTDASKAVGISFFEFDNPKQMTSFMNAASEKIRIVLEDSNPA